MFRLISEKIIVKYDEFVIQTKDGQSPKIVDILSSSCGDYLCVSLRLYSLGPLLSDRSPEKIPRLGIESEIIESADGMTDFTFRMAEHDYEGAINCLDSLQSPYDHSLGILANKCTISRLVGPKAFRNAVLQMSQSYPEEIPSELKLLELYQTEKEPVDMMAVADRLHKSMQDPWLNAYRIDGLITQNRIREAREAIAAAKTAAPNISDPYVAELGMLMKLKNHQETAQAIETLEMKFGDKVVKLTEFPEFNEFSDSEVGRHFLAKRAGFDF